MVRFSMAAALAAASVLVGGHSALADVSAQDVWADLQSYLEATGYTISTTGENKSGDTLTISDLSAFFPIEDTDGKGEGRIELQLDEMQFRELSNGSVEISMSDDYTFSIAGGDEGENLNLVLTIAQTGLSIIASGTAEETSYDIVAASLNMQATTFEVNGEQIDGDIRMDLSSYTAAYTLNSAEVTSVRGEGRIDTIDLAVAMNAPEQDIVLDLNAGIRDLSAMLDTTIPDGYETKDVSTALADGFGGAGRYEMSSLTFDMTGESEGESFALTVTTGAAGFMASLAETGFAFAQNAQDLDIVLSASSMPLPQLLLSAAEYGLEMVFPVTPSPESQDFRFAIRLADFVLPEEIWQLGDPTGALPHDPLTVIVDTSGAGRLMADPFVPDGVATEELPMEVDRFSLDSLEIAAVGAELTGDGDFNFDNTDLTSFDGIPRPEGQIDLRLTGANALLDTLVAMGMLPEDQAMGARMMMGLFAVAGPGEDELTSTIEINAEGQVLANGQRLR